MPLLSMAASRAELFLELRDKLRTCDGGDAGVVLNLDGRTQLATDVEADHGHRKILSCGIERSGEAGRAGTDDHYVS